MVKRAAKGRRNRGPAIAFWLEYPSLPACEIAALVGYDAVIFDHEHGVIPPGEADNLAFACKRLGLTTFSRVATADRVDIQHARQAAKGKEAGLAR